MSISPTGPGTLASPTKTISIAGLAPLTATGLPPTLGVNELVSWLSDRIRTTDTDIRNHMAGVSGLKDRQAGLSNLIKALRDIKACSTGDGSSFITADSIERLKSPDIADNPDVGPTIKNLLVGVTGDPPRIPTANFDEAIKALGDKQSALSTEGEVGMIKLQSEMAARGQLISLVSNILAAVNETAKGIVAKVGQ